MAYRRMLLSLGLLGLLHAGCSAGLPSDLFGASVAAGSSDGGMDPLGLDGSVVGNDGGTPGSGASGVDGGALGTEKDGGAPGESPAPGPSLDCVPDQIFRPSEPYTPAAGAPKDETICYGVDVTNAARRHIVAMAPRIDNPNLLHHVRVFEATDALPSKPAPCTVVQRESWRLVSAWSAGGAAVVFPKEAGLPQEAGTTHYVVQLHYSPGATQKDQKDASGLQLCTTATLRPNDIGVLELGALRKFAIPPRTTRHTIECSYNLPMFAPAIQFVAVMPHMHGLGQSTGTQVFRSAYGAGVSLLDAPKYNPDQPQLLPSKEGALGGDTFRTRCTWTNPSPSTVSWGESAQDEMCLNYAMYYPRLGAGMFPGAGAADPKAPARESACRMVPP